MFDTDTSVRAYQVWLDGWISTRVLASDWFDALKLAIPRFGVDLDPDRLLVTLQGDTVHCEDLAGARTLAVEVLAA